LKRPANSHKRKFIAAKVIANAGLSEERVRVICHLPLRIDPGYKEAFQKVLKYLERQRNRVVPITGYTHSSFRPPAFHGFWYGTTDAERDSKNAGPAWVYDPVVLLIIDVESNLQDSRLERLLERLKGRIFKIYEDHGCLQSEIWIIAHNAFRT
jgi:hypothetical protein